tara:strand:- start:914 stop:1108 length:195 start_codon:yes stop_codon:yes gene_type:complete
MIKCSACKELISNTSMSYKISSGFYNEDGSFQEDVTLIIHSECVMDYNFHPFSVIEKRLKDGDV